MAVVTRATCVWKMKKATAVSKKNCTRNFPQYPLYGWRTRLFYVDILSNICGTCVQNVAQLGSGAGDIIPRQWPAFQGFCLCRMEIVGQSNHSTRVCSVSLVKSHCVFLSIVCDENRPECFIVHVRAMLFSTLWSTCPSATLLPLLLVSMDRISFSASVMNNPPLWY